jgi:hypothetical protein
MGRVSGTCVFNTSSEKTQHTAQVYELGTITPALPNARRRACGGMGKLVLFVASYELVATPDSLRTHAHLHAPDAGRRQTSTANGVRTLGGNE